MRMVITLLFTGVMMSAVPAPTAAQGGVRWQEDPYQARQIAQAEQRLMLLHFYTDWCGPCRKLDREVFPQSEVTRTISSNYIPVKVNADRYKDIAKFYRVDRYPMDVIVDANGREVFRSVTPQDASRYVQMLEGVAADFRYAVPGYGASRNPVATNDPGIPRDQDPRFGPGAPAGSSPYVVAPGVQDNRFAAAPGPAGNGNPYAVGRPSRSRSELPLGPESSPNSFSRPDNSVAHLDPAAAAPRQAGYEPAYGNQSQAPRQPAADYGVGPADAGARGGAYVGNPYASPPSYVANRPAAATSSNPAPQEIQNRFAADPRAAQTGPEPPLALDGFCPVTLAEREVWERGDPRWGAVHRGRTYLFTSAEGQQRFLADPDRYSPMLSGYDVVRYIDRGETLAGTRRHGMWYQGKMYLFADEASLDQFARSPDIAQRYAARTQELMMASGR